MKRTLLLLLLCTACGNEYRPPDAYAPTLPNGYPIGCPLPDGGMGPYDGICQADAGVPDGGR